MARSVPANAACFLAYEMENMGGEESLSVGSSHISSTIVEGQYMPLNVAAQQVHSKGSLLDRITFLEERLVQLRLEIESPRTLRTSAMHMSLTASSSFGSKRELLCSYPTFNNANPPSKRMPQIHINRGELQRKFYRPQQRQKQPNTKKQELENNRDDKTCRNGKNTKPSSWPHMRLLGC
ncbi:unnamed protein product [Ilex paraguariensis]|uniref:Uncharacterized protein n=1 Tax=Ilex paraguariensis TaxID=185542 RepID=A0ABC8RZU5_9AQUA